MAGTVFGLRADTEKVAGDSADGQAEEAANEVSVEASPEASADTFVVYVIPIEGPIGKPTLFTIRSGIKDAIEKDASLVLFEMETPGGELNATLEIMKVIENLINYR